MRPATESSEHCTIHGINVRVNCEATVFKGDADIARDFERMEKLGREMVTKCAGLPLAIVILGGTLVTKPSLIEWEKVYDDSLSSLKKGKGLGETQQGELFDILVRSYNALPPQLKPCFSYLSKFMEDDWIDAETLYQLWISEGMVLSSDKREGETMMQVAESYLGELVHRSMVQVRFNDLESSLTKFESCCLHDLMRDLSLFQAKAEDFFKTIDLREGNDFHLNSSVVSQAAKTRQLVVYYESELEGKKVNSYFIKKPDHQEYRSILLLNVEGFGGSALRLGSYIGNFKLLRVLSLENLCCAATLLGALFGKNMEDVLESLVYLRYLSLWKSNVEIFLGIQKLVLLQTLKLRTPSYTLMPVVSSNVLGKLAYLRHLYLPDWFFTTSEKITKLRFNGLSKLETLEHFDTRFCEVKDLPKLSSLRRLTLIEEGGYDDAKEMFKYLSELALSSNSCIRYLTLVIKMSDQGFKNDADMIRQLLCNHKFNLQYLVLDGRNLPELCELFKEQQQLNHTHIHASSIRITKLQLRYSYLKKDPMPVLEKVPTLRELYIRDAYKGKAMVCSATGFPRLTRLHLYSFTNLKKWRVENGSMAILQHLVIENCEELEELPEGLIFLSSLRELILTWMPLKFCDRVRLENGEQGLDFYKVAHVPDLIVGYRT